ncbi:hypothetical protein L6452_06111 [Arctium lappa]|uniref:Uncharacterized protein n=1 Tax=Arctium lappa TaxID=4217 RepID=A0ACB9EHS0_ARCLA|nr:hypothetical protein L6452_06111 [Arctium lappa]
MGYFFDDDEKKIEKLKLENKNLASSVDYYSNRSKKYHDERKILREEVSALKTINEDLLKQTSGLNEEKVLFLEAENTELKNKISELEDHIVKFQQTGCANEKEIFELELQIVEERSVFDKERKEFAKKFSEFSRKFADEKKTFAKERKTIEQNNVGIFKEISGQRTNAEMGFEEERSLFEAEIKKLTANLRELSTCVLIEQQTKSEFKTKIDLLVKERDSYSSKVKELEKIVSKVVVTEQTTPESKIHSPRNSSVGSNKQVSSSHQQTVSTKRSFKYSNQIRITNLFCGSKIDGSGTHRRRRYTEEKLVWRVKPVVENETNDEKKEEKKGKKEENKSNKSFVHASTAKKNKVLKVTPIRAATYIHGPKYQWVPKPKDDSVLQASTVKGEFEKIWMNTWLRITESTTQFDRSEWSKTFLGRKELESGNNISKGFVFLKAHVFLLRIPVANCVLRIAFSKVVLLANSELEELLSMGSQSKPPVPSIVEYSQWKRKMIQFLNHKNKDYMKSIIDGPFQPVVAVPGQAATKTSPEIPVRYVPRPYQYYSEREKELHKIDEEAVIYLTMAIPNDIYNRVDSRESAKAMWDELERQF